MHSFSGKISNAFIRYLQREGRDIYLLLREVNASEELLCNPECWIDSEIMEKLLYQACSIFDNKAERRTDAFSGESLLEKVGHETHLLSAWGALDWALKMMEDPWDTFQQPEMLLSYFISPKPKVHHLKWTEKRLCFSLPFQEADYPFVNSYLKAAIASLPCYRNKNRAKIKWQGYELTIEKQSQEMSLFTSETRGNEYHFNPSLISSILESLQPPPKNLSLPKKEREGPFPLLDRFTPSSYELVQNSLQLLKEYINNKKIKIYQNSLLCDAKFFIHSPKHLQNCFNLLFSLILSFVMEEETIYIHHSLIEQKWMEIKISLNKIAPKEKGNTFLSSIEGIKQMLIFTLKKEKAHMEIQKEEQRQSISFYFPLHKDYWLN